MRIVLASLVVGLLLLPFASAHAQRSCATDSVHAHMMGLAGYAEVFQAKVNAVNQASENALECASPLIIPVAVHFQNTGIPEACAIEMALDQIQILNDDFAATNADIGDWYAQQPTIWPGISNAESCIQFCLATTDHPAGFGLAEGDYAVTIDQTTGDFSSAWSGYLNFWVRDLSGGILGYSPLGGNGNGDGVACTTSAFSSVSCGGNTISSAFNLGRTITHEVGHYLLLNHPWANGGCSSNDNVADTPVTSEPIFGCPSGQSIVNCTDPVLWPSYMDYCNDACLFMFSAGQVTRMENYVTSSLQNLLNNAVTACQDPCESLCGCTDPGACNYDAAAANDDGSCDYSCQGCTDSTACNYDPDATSDDGSCTYPAEGFPCDCSLDFPFDMQNAGTGVGVSETIQATATGAVSSLSIELEFSDVTGGSSWAGDLLLGLCDPSGSCIEIGGYDMSLGLTDAGNWPSGWNTAAEGTYTATINLESYGLTGAGDWTIDLINGWSSTSASASWVGTITFDDLCAGESGPDVEGCTDDTACNYDAAATVSDASCTYATGCDYCSGATNGTGTVIDGDTDNDGICDADEVAGCQDEFACNYDPAATDAATCEYAAEGYDCDGNPLSCPEDINGNGTVEVSDVLLLLADFGCVVECSAADIDGDGAVSVTDVLLLLAAFGEDC